MRAVLRKSMLWDKYFKYQNFPTNFRLSLFSRCFGEIWRESVKSIYPINSLKVAVFLPKCQCPNGTRELPGVYDDGARFLARSNPLQPRIFFYLDHSVERWGGRHNNDLQIWKILVWQRLLSSKSGRQRGAPPVPVTFTKEFISFLDGLVPCLSSYSLFSFSSGFDFSTSKDFSINKELPRGNFVKCAM